MSTMPSKHLALMWILILRMTAAEKDYYSILGVGHSATNHQIKKAFYKLAMKYHPDKNSSPDAEVLFREIAEAYNVLSSEKRRQRYDEVGHEVFVTDSEDERVFGEQLFSFDFSEIFQNHFEEDLYFSVPEGSWDFHSMDDGEEAYTVLASGLNINVESIKVTAAGKDEDSLVFTVKSQELSSSKEHFVDRKFEDFVWVQCCLLSQDEVPGLQGIIFPPLPAKPYVSLSNTQAKMIKQLGLLGLREDWQTYCKALEKYLQQVVSHTILSKNLALQSFLTLKERPGGHVRRKGIFNRLSRALEAITKENHKDIDEYFQNERNTNLHLAHLTKAAAEKFLDLVLTQQKISLACGHLSTSLHLGITQDENPTAMAFPKLCLKLSEIIDTVKQNYENVVENNLSSLGLMLDLDSRYQEAEKEMLFRRTCKLVELEHINKNLEKAKSVKKATLEEEKKSTEKEFKLISDVAKLEIETFHNARLEAFQQYLTAWCQSHIYTARDTLNSFLQHLDTFRVHESMK